MAKFDRTDKPIETFDVEPIPSLDEIVKRANIEPEDITDDVNQNDPKPVHRDKRDDYTDDQVY